MLVFFFLHLFNVTFFASQFHGLRADSPPHPPPFQVLWFGKSDTVYGKTSLMKFTGAGQSGSALYGVHQRLSPGVHPQSNSTLAMEHGWSDGDSDDISQVIVQT